MIANLTTRWKKQALFLQAAARLKGRAEFRLYGQGADADGDPYVAGLKRLADAGGARLMGFVPAEEALRETDVLVHTADGESFGRIIVEGMAAGRAVVGPNAGGAGELIDDGKTGLTFSTDDLDALVAVLTRLCDAPQLRTQLGDRARDVARAQYSIAACADRIADAYRAAMERPLRSFTRLLAPLVSA
jgi:glycosyltransferase involved in cell wall biosynthesis